MTGYFYPVGQDVGQQKYLARPPSEMESVH